VFPIQLAPANRKQQHPPSVLPCRTSTATTRTTSCSHFFSGNVDARRRNSATPVCQSSEPFFPTSTSTTSKAALIAQEHKQQEESVPLIEFRNVHKSFGSKHILKGASFKIYRGESVGIIGSSGTGKSTTLRLAAGLLEPDQGEILIKGEARRGLLSDDDTSDKLKIGLVFQSGTLFDSLTVKQNVGFMLYEHTSMTEQDISAAVAASLAKVGLSGVERLYPSELSGGMKKRVALARAIVTDNSSTNTHVEQVIMYDEPTAGLDPVASTVIEDLIRSMQDPLYCTHTDESLRSNLQDGCGVSSYIVVTHQHSTIRRSVDRIIFLHDGKVVWQGDVSEFETTPEPIVRQFASGSLDGPIVYM
jgi:ABC-type transporter Mla maintaining outer membrane lipid asymmetry ATPase subunit MlaF